MQIYIFKDVFLRKLLIASMVRCEKSRLREILSKSFGSNKDTINTIFQFNDFYQLINIMEKFNF